MSIFGGLDIDINDHSRKPHCDCGGRDMSKYNVIDDILGISFGDELHNELYDHSPRRKE